MHRLPIKRGYLVALFILLLLTVLRETGWLGINLFKRNEQSSTRYHKAFPNLNATRLEFIEDNGQPFFPHPTTIEETYHVVVRYRLEETYTWGRWIPLIKGGHNRVQLLYTVWTGGSLMGAGAIDCDSLQYVYGLCSAWEYQNNIVAPLLEKMKQTVKEKVSIFQYQEPK